MSSMKRFVRLLPLAGTGTPAHHKSAPSMCRIGFHLVASLPAIDAAVNHPAPVFLRHSSARFSF